MHCIGIDAGGTNLRIAWRTDRGDIVEQMVDAEPGGGPGPLESVLQSLPERPRCVVAGITKFTRSGVTTQWSRNLATWFPGCHIEIVPDWHIAHAGAFGNQDGVLVIAGTGSVAVGRKDGVLHRTGGRGWEYGDEGSGAHLTSEIIRRTIRSMDGLAGGTPLASRLMDKIGETDAALFAEACRHLSRERGRGFLVPFLAECAVAQDPEAIDLFRGAAGWLSRLCASNATRCGFDRDQALPFCTVGGIFESGPWVGEIFPTLLRRQYPLAQPVPATQSPLHGALTLAESNLAD